MLNQTWRIRRCGRSQRGLEIMEPLCVWSGGRLTGGGGGLPLHTTCPDVIDILQKVTPSQNVAAPGRKSQFPTEPTKGRHSWTSRFATPLHKGHARPQCGQRRHRSGGYEQFHTHLHNGPCPRGPLCKFSSPPRGSSNSDTVSTCSTRRLVLLYTGQSTVSTLTTSHTLTTPLLCMLYIHLTPKQPVPTTPPPPVASPPLWLPPWKQETPPSPPQLLSPLQNEEPWPSWGFFA